MVSSHESSVYTIDRKLRAAIARANRELGCPTLLTLKELHTVYRGPRPQEVGYLASYASRHGWGQLTYRFPMYSARYLKDRKLFNFFIENR
jgi:hypothetical protein